MPLNKLPKSLFIVFGIMIFAMNLAAWSVSDYYLGNSTPSFSARNLGMGNTGTFDTFSPMSIYLNPANLTMMENTIGLTANGLFTRNEDNRSFPLYNSFDAFIDDATYSSNINFYDDYGFGGYFKKALNEKFMLGLGLNYLPTVNFKGTYDEEIRNNGNSDNDLYPQIIAINKINNSGRLNDLAVSLGGGFKTGKDMEIHLGMTLSNLDGKSEFQKSIKWTEYSMQQLIDNYVVTGYPELSHRNVLPDSLYTNNSDISGSRIKYGINFKVNSRLGIGFSYTQKSEMNRNNKINYLYGPDTTMTVPAGVINLASVDSTRIVKDKYIMPSRYRIGFNYQPRNIMRTYINAEVEYTSWSEVSKLLDDCWDIHVGVEHSVNNRIPLRLGFQTLTEWQIIPDYNNLTENSKPTLDATKIITPSITAGSSAKLMKNLVLDIGLSFSWREYQALDLFRDGYYNDKTYTGLTSYFLWPNSYTIPTDRGWENADKIRESFTQLSAGLTWTW